MNVMEASEAPSGHTPEGGVLVGSEGARRRLVLFEDPQCPHWSVRAANALAAAAEVGGFDELRRAIFANQPPEHSGGFTTEDLLALGRRVGLTSPGYVAAVREGRYASWVREIDEVFAEQDPDGTPSGVLDGKRVDSETLYDPDALGALIRG